MSLGIVAVFVVLLGLTSGLMVWLRVSHPPAGATTLIVSPWASCAPAPSWGCAMLAVVLLTTQRFIINRAVGIDYPVWAPRQS